MVDQQNADTADILQLRDVTRANSFWLSIYAAHIGATRRIRLNRPCVVAMRPYMSNYFDHLFIFRLLSAEC